LLAQLFKLKLSGQYCKRYGWEHTNFNTRLQPTQIGLGTTSTNSSVLQLDYGYGTTTHNGNLLGQTVTIPGLGLSQTYGSDALNRLETAGENAGVSWKQKFLYDRYGFSLPRMSSKVDLKYHCLHA
jgi:hypothetical protein